MAKNHVCQREGVQVQVSGGMMIGLGMALPIGKWILGMMLLEPKLEGRHNNIVMKEAANIEGKNGFSSGSLQRCQVLRILQVLCPMLTGTVTCTCPAFRKIRTTS